MNVAIKHGGGYDPRKPRVIDTTLPPYDKPCVTCCATPGARCVVAIEYMPIVLDIATSQIGGGERRPDGLYFPKPSPHIKRGAP